jgi:iron complex outermembrane receptor protein
MQVVCILWATQADTRKKLLPVAMPLGSSNTFKNGARFNNGVTPELSGVEKIEFLKGGSAILFGNVSPGGLMNIVTKKPKFEKGGEISFRTGSYDFYKPSIDIYGNLANSKTSAYRLNSSYEKSRSFRDQVSGERVYFNPSLLIKTSPKSELLLEGDYLHDNRTADFGIGSINYTIPDVSRSSFIGVDWGYNKATQTTATATFTHHFSDNWQARVMYSYQNYQQDLFSAARANTNGQMVSTNGTWIRGLQKSASIENYNVAEVNINGNFHTWNVKHQLTFGADNDRYETEATAFNTTLYNNNLNNPSLKNKNIYDTINIFSPTQNRHDIPDLTAARITTTPIVRYGFYAQDLISVTNQLKLLAGLRYSSQENRTSTVDTVGKSRGYIAGYTSNALSPKIGLVYQPMKYMSIFASYTNNFSPNNGTDINNIPLKPSIIDQYELGMKNDLWRGLVSVNLTGYIIVNDNFAQSVVPAPPSNPTARELAGEVTSKGVEVDIMTKPIHGFSFIAGYSYNDSRYTESNVFKENDRLRYTPANTANASLYYEFNESSVLSRLNLGLGAYYVGERVAGRNTTPANPTYALMEVPDYALLDFSMGYQHNRLSVRLKLSNLMNVLSYNIHDDNSVNPIAPRQFSLSVAPKILIKT